MPHIPLGPSRARMVASAAAAVALLWGATPLAAQSSTTINNNVTTFYQRSSDPAPEPVYLDQLLCGPTAATIDGSCGVTGLNAYAASAVLPGGVLKTETRLSATGAVVTLSSRVPADAVNAGFTAAGSIVLTDRVSFGGFTPSVLRFTYFVDGTLSNTLPPGGLTYANAGIAVQYRSAQTVPLSSVPLTDAFRDVVIGGTTQSSAVDRRGFFDIALVAGSPLDFGLRLVSYSQVGGGGGPGRPLTGMAESDFFSTARFGVQALDAQGNDITSQAALSFASGTSYPTAATVVPEPGTWALLGTGLVALGGVTRRRKRAV